MERCPEQPRAYGASRTEPGGRMEKSRWECERKWCRYLCNKPIVSQICAESLYSAFKILSLDNCLIIHNYEVRLVEVWLFLLKL